MTPLDLAYALGALLLSPFWARKARGGWAARFGKIAPLAPAVRPRLLLHAVSVGEVNTLRTLVPLLRKHVDVVVSASTDTGLARAHELFGAAAKDPAMHATVVRYPLDFSWSVERFLTAVNPTAVALVELEVWPQFVRACTRRGIPVAVINGRLSERSFKGYRRIKPFIGPSFASLAFAAVQNDAYAERFRTMGVAPNRVIVTDSMKWDSATFADSVPGAEQLATELGIDRSRPLIIAGSTGPDEEALLHRACPAGVQLLCAPRRPERFDEARAALPGCAWRRGSAAAIQTHRATATSERFLLSTIGELRAAYSLADLVVMGRSFGKLYGSDPVEPIALGKATIIGPRFKDFESAVAALVQAGGLEVVQTHDLAPRLTALINDPAACAAMAAAGRACIRAHMGATARHADLLLSLAQGRATMGL